MLHNVKRSRNIRLLNKVRDPLLLLEHIVLFLMAYRKSEIIQMKFYGHKRSSTFTKLGSVMFNIDEERLIQPMTKELMVELAKEYKNYDHSLYMSISELLTTENRHPPISKTKFDGSRKL